MSDKPYAFDATHIDRLRLTGRGSVDWYRDGELRERVTSDARAMAVRLGRPVHIFSWTDRLLAVVGSK